jgi:hypothetical protein
MSFSHWVRSLNCSLFLQGSASRRSGRWTRPRRRVQLLLDALEDRTLLSATLWTDQGDYAPGSTAVIDGSGFSLGETVRLQVDRLIPPGTPGLPGTEPWSVTDGGQGDLDGAKDGNIRTSWYVDPVYLGATLQVTATGQTSGESATALFTDGNVKANMTSPVANDSFTLTYSRYNSSGTFLDSGTQTINASNGSGTTVSSSNAAFVRMDAAFTSDRSGVSRNPTILFDHWLKNGNPFGVSRSIFVTDFATAGTTYTAVYVVAQGTPQVMTPTTNLTASEGTATAFTLGQFDDPDGGPWSVTVDWGDGTIDPAFTMAAPGTFPPRSHVYADNGVYTGTVTVTDSTGHSGTDGFIVPVSNVPPVVTAPSDQSVNRKTSQSFSLGRFGDPGLLDYPWSIDVNWGDNSAHTTFTQVTQGPITSQPHTYTTDGVETVTVQVTDKDGGTGTATFLVYVGTVVRNTNDSGPGSLRDVINLANADPGRDTISFAIPAGDGHHYYYKDDGVAGHVSLASRALAVDANGNPVTSDADLLNPSVMGAGRTADPDYPSSWWSIQPASALPRITDPVTIDGYSQPGARENTLGIGPGSDGHLSGDGDNAILRVELSGENPGVHTRGISGLSIDLTNSTAGKSSTIRGLVINRFVNGVGITLTGNVGSVIAGNFVGPDVSGTLAPDGSNYYRFHPAQAVPYIPAAQSIMSDGVLFNQGSGNIVGTNADGQDDAGERNVLSATNFAVVFVTGCTGNAVAGNFIGTNRDGKEPAVETGPGPGSTHLGNLLGIAFLNGSAADIGRTGAGPLDASRRNLISGNYFGAAAGNAASGGGGAVSVAQIRGNWIGTDITGNGPLGNTFGVSIFGSSENPVGPDLVDAPVSQAAGLELGNVIAFNHGSAIGVADSFNPRLGAPPLLSFGNVLRGNSIHDNWQDYQSAGGGAAIDLFGLVKFEYLPDYGDYGAGANWPIPFLADHSDPLTPLPPLPAEARPLLNGTRQVDATNLSNRFQAYPELTAASSAGSTSIAFTLHTTPSRKFWVDFYATDKLGALGPDGRYYGEGRTFLGSWAVTTNGNGDAAGTAVLPTNLPAYPSVYLTATATDATTGDTSEFSADLTVPAANIAPLTSPNLQPVIDMVPATAAAQTVLDVVPVPAESKLVLLSGTTDTQVHEIITAVNGLAPQSTPVVVIVKLDPGVFTGVTASPPAGVTLVLVGSGTPTTFTGHSPALTVLSGAVLVSDLSLTNATDAPTVLVAGGSLGLRNVLVQESTGFSDAAIALTGGSVDLGTAASPGGNVIDVNGAGEFVHNTTLNAVAAVGVSFQADGTTLPARDLSFTALTSSAAVPLLGDAVTFLATVRANGDGAVSPGGNVGFFDATTNTDLGSVPLSGGSAALTTSSLAVGGHVIWARYGGDNDFLLSQDSTLVTVIPPASLSGLVFEDFNDDGQVDFGEQGVPGVTITLTGTDDLGHSVNRSQQTDGDGLYSFANLRPGNYYLGETQPSGYLQGIDSVGTAGGSLVATDQFFVRLGAGIDGINYNYGERPPAGGPVQHGQTAGIGFWHNQNGQDLIKALNGGSSNTQLAHWLAATFPRMYGAQAGSHSLIHPGGSYFSNAEVAAFYLTLFNQSGPKLDAQVLAAALSVYVTNATLDPDHVAAGYGFTVSGDGVGTATVNVGSNGDAFGVPSNSTLMVMDLLLATDAQTLNGVLYDGNTTRRNEANNVYSALDQSGGIN